MSEPLHKLVVNKSNVTILGTAHVSRTSADTVQCMIRSKDYDIVCIELCQSRYNSIMKPSLLAEMDLFDVIRQGKASMVTASLALGAYQQRLAEQLGIEPGIEMKTAIAEAEKHELPLVLIDREVGTTLKRVYSNVPFWKRIFLIAGLFSSVLSRDEVTEEEIEQLKSGDILETTFTQFSEDAKELFLPLIDERDQYMAAKLLHVANEYKNKSILAIVGAGHMKGIKAYLENGQLDAERTINTLDIVPRKKSWFKFIPWLIVVLVLIGFYLGFQKSPDLGWSLIWQWIVINGGLSAFGAAIAGAHMVTILVAFLAAPITSLNPTIGAGMVTAAMELFLRKPTVKDFGELRNDTTTVKGWRKNRVARILLVFILSSLGSAIGTYVAGFRIFNQIM